jgi:hypothetical protein
VDAAELLNVSIISPLTNGQKQKLSALYQVRNQCILKCLSFLVENNHLYIDVNVNYDNVSFDPVDYTALDESSVFDNNMNRHSQADDNFEASDEYDERALTTRSNYILNSSGNDRSATYQFALKHNLCMYQIPAFSSKQPVPLLFLKSKRPKNL